jgi:membrane-bound lytic murein transglycosylase B
MALSDVLGDALKLLAILAVGVVILALVAVATVVALPFGLVLSPGVTVVPPAIGATGDVAEIPPDQLRQMQEVGASSGVPWQILAAIAKVESDLGRNMATSSAGAIGYGQFLPSSWAVYGQGGNPYDYRDAIPAMARYLVANGAHEDLPGAIWAYNHADWYVQMVLSQARAYGYGDAPSATRTEQTGR